MLAIRQSRKRIKFNIFTPINWFHDQTPLSENHHTLDCWLLSVMSSPWSSCWTRDSLPISFDPTLYSDFFYKKGGMQVSVNFNNINMHGSTWRPLAPHFYYIPSTLCTIAAYQLFVLAISCRIFCCGWRIWCNTWFSCFGSRHFLLWVNHHEFKRKYQPLNQ